MVSTLSLTIFSCYNNIKKGFSPNQHIGMITEESCDTKDWSSNDAENSAFHHKNKIVFIIYSNGKTVF